MRRIFTLAIAAVMVTASIAIGDVTIAFMSDGRPKEKGEAALKYDFDQLLVQMDTGWTLDAVQHIGDMDYIAYEDGQNTFDAYAASTASGVPLFHCIGNHELNNQYDLYDVRAAFEDYPFNPVAGPNGTEHTTYYYEVGDLLVVVINEYWDGNNDGDGDWYTPSGGPDDDESTFKYSTGDGGYIPDELYDWLANVLSTSNKTYKLVVGHEPAYPVDRHVGDSLDKDPANRDKFWNLLKTKGVTAYMTAHDHNFHLDEHDGVFEADSGVCGGMLGGGGPGENDNFATIIYAHIDDQTGNFEFKAVHEQPGANNWDNPVVIREILTPPSPVATNPNPADGAEDVAVEADLSWTAGAGAESHDIYLGITTPPPFIQNQAETTYAPPESLEPDTTYYWRIDEFDGTTTHTGTVWSFTTAPVPGAAGNPNPDGTTPVAVDADLSWTAGSDAASHNVYFGDSYPPPFVQNQDGTTYDAGTMNYETTYYWRVDEVGPGGVTTGVAWSFTTEPVPEDVDDVANSESTANGTVTGSYVDTQFKDAVYEVIEEVLDKPNKNAASILEHKWVFNVTGGNLITFHLEAYKSVSSDGDDFVFAYSMDDSTYTDMLTVTKTSDDDTYQTYTLPGSTTGTVYIRVMDTDRTRGNSELDSIYVDHMFIRSSVIVAPPEQANNPSPADEAEDVAVDADLSWTAGAGTESHNVYFGAMDPPAFAGNQSETTFDPGTLEPSTTYFWRVDELNSFGTTTGVVWNFTTKISTGEVYVYDIEMSSKKAGKNYSGLATVWIKNDLGANVEGATVSGVWSGAVDNTSTGVTEQDGKVILRSSNKKDGGTFTVTITGVVAPGYTYNEALNVETSDSITAP